MLPDHDHALSRADDFGALVRSINATFNAQDGPVFRTDAGGLVEIFLASFTDPDVRRQHSCACCRSFIERFGGLATVGDDGGLASAVWDPATVPAPYRAVAEALRQRVSQASISILFLSDSPVYGKPAGGPWPHLAITPAKLSTGSGPHDAWHTARVRREAFGLALRGLRRYSAPVCAAALHVLEAGPLPNPEVVLSEARFLVDLHLARAAVRGPQQKDNLVYRMVATAPLRFCHPRSGRIASLLDDLTDGKPVAQAAASWDAKVDAIRFRDPPTAEAIRAARIVVAELGVADALPRRFATMADIEETEWRPHPRYARADQVGFPVRAPLAMTFNAFLRTVLPVAERIEMAALAGRQPFVALTSAMLADAAPIMKWDTRKRHNAVDWYWYRRGSLASEFNLTGSVYEVSAIILPPWRWAGRSDPHHGQQLAFLLKDARDLRSAIGAFRLMNPPAGAGNGNVAGLAMTRGTPCKVSLRVTSKGQVRDYLIDRWD